MWLNPCVSSISNHCTLGVAFNYQNEECSGFRGTGSAASVCNLCVLPSHGAQQQQRQSIPRAVSGRSARTFLLLSHLKIMSEIKWVTMMLWQVEPWTQYGLSLKRKLYNTTHLEVSGTCNVFHNTSQHIKVSQPHIWKVLVHRFHCWTMGYHFTCIASFNSHNIPVKWEVNMLFPTYLKFLSYKGETIIQVLQFCVARRGHWSMNGGKEGPEKEGRQRDIFMIECARLTFKRLFLHSSSPTIEKWCCYTGILQCLFYKFIFPLWWVIGKKRNWIQISSGKRHIMFVL